MFRLASLSVLLWLAVSPTPAGVIVGPGNVPIDAGDGSHDLIAMDLNNPAPGDRP